MTNADDDAAIGRRRVLFGAGAAALLTATGLAHAGQERLEPSIVRVEPLARHDAIDWKDALLAGDRSILMRREGPTKRIRYGNGDGSLDRDGYYQACYLLRDVRADKTVQIDPQLLDVLCGIQRWMEFNGRNSTIEVTSGYRTRKTNDSAEGSGRHSMHLYGKAADIVVPGAPSTLIGAMVLRFNSHGGTGIYPGRDFVHVDTGRSRIWVTPVTGSRTRRRRRR